MTLHFPRQRQVHVTFGPRAFQNGWRKISDVSLKILGVSHNDLLQSFWECLCKWTSWSWNRMFAAQLSLVSRHNVSRHNVIHVVRILSFLHFLLKFINLKTQVIGFFLKSELTGFTLMGFKVCFALHEYVSTSLLWQYFSFVLEELQVLVFNNYTIVLQHCIVRQKFQWVFYTERCGSYISRISCW